MLKVNRGSYPLGTFNRCITVYRGSIRTRKGHLIVALRYITVVFVLCFLFIVFSLSSELTESISYSQCRTL